MGEAIPERGALVERLLAELLDVPLIAELGRVPALLLRYIESREDCLNGMLLYAHV